MVRLRCLDSCDLLCLDLEAAEEVRGGLDSERAVALAEVAKVFADSTRVLIVQALSRRELCGCDLGWVTGQSEKVVSHHLGRLSRGPDRQPSSGQGGVRIAERSRA